MTIRRRSVSPDGSPLERLTVPVSAEIMDRIDALAVAQGRTRAEAARGLLDLGLAARDLQSLTSAAAARVESLNGDHALLQQILDAVNDIRRRAFLENV